MNTSQTRYRLKALGNVTVDRAEYRAGDTFEVATEFDMSYLIQHGAAEALPSLVNEVAPDVDTVVKTGDAGGDSSETGIPVVTSKKGKWYGTRESKGRDG